MKFYEFNEEYIRRLATGDPFVESHFTAYFGELIFLKFRSRVRSRELIEDVRQETLLRVIQLVRAGNGIEQPEKLGAFVNSVSNNVLFELLRKERRYSQIDPEDPEPSDRSIDLDLPLINEERKRLVESVLDEMSQRDRKILRLLYFDELPAEVVCRMIGVDGEYLRVLCHRAKSRFRHKLKEIMAAAATPAER